jgi:hypothetical protein
VFDNAPPGTLGPRGTAFYRKNITVSSNTPALLYIAACSFYCNVLVDGQSIGDHRAGALPARHPSSSPPPPPALPTLHHVPCVCVSVCLCPNARLRAGGADPRAGSL